MFSKFSSKYPTTKQNMKPSYTASDWPSHSATSGYWSTETPSLWSNKVNKEWDINKETMDAYVAKIRKLENKFSGLEIHHVNCDNNVGADVLSKLGST